MLKENLLTVELPEILQTLNIQQLVDGIAVLHNSYKYTTSIMESRPFRSQHFSVILVTQGKLILQVNLFTYEVEKGDLIIVPPSAIKHFQLLDKIEFYSILFTPQYLFDSGFYQKFFKLFSFFNSESHCILKLNEDDTDFAITSLSLIQNQLSATDFSSTNTAIVALHFQAFLLHLLKYTETQITKEQSVYQNDIIHRFLTLLPKTFKENREVNFYADQLNINPKYLTQVLKKKTGKSARDFITEMVVMEAKILLDHPQNTIRDIAEQLNFSDQFHFSHFFKKYTSLSPLQYRNQESNF